MSHSSYMYNYLYQKPQVGIVSGIGTGMLMKIQTLLTDDYVLKLVSGLGTFVGCAIAVLALIIQVIKVYDIIKIRIKIKKP